MHHEFVLNQSELRLCIKYLTESILTVVKIRYWQYVRKTPALLYSYSVLHTIFRLSYDNKPFSSESRDIYEFVVVSIEWWIEKTKQWVLILVIRVQLEQAHQQNVSAHKSQNSPSKLSVCFWLCLISMFWFRLQFH